MDLAAAVLKSAAPRTVPAESLLGPAATFELEMLRAGLRGLVRLTLPRSGLGPFMGRLSGEGLHCHRWRFDLLSNGKASLDGFSVGGRAVAADLADAACPVLFVAREPRRLNDLDILADDDWWMGIALGYPPCCISRFCDRSGSLTRGYDHYFEGETGPFPCWANALAEPFGYLLLSHFPCGPGCTASRSLATAALAHLLDSRPADALRMLSGLKRLILYHPLLGILTLAREGLDSLLPLAGAQATGQWRRLLDGRTVLPAELHGDHAVVRLEAAADAAPFSVRLLDFRGGM